MPNGYCKYKPRKKKEEFPISVVIGNIWYNSKFK